MWSVKTLIDFSFIPGINEALEGDTRIELYRYHEDMEDSEEELLEGNVSGDNELTSDEDGSA